MVSKTIRSLFGLTLIMIAGTGLVYAQAGCELIDKTKPAQSLSFERLEDETVTTRRHPTKVVLRFRNNSTCDVTLLSYDQDPRAIEIIRRQNGTPLFRFTGPDDYPDGGRLEIKYHIDYQQPLPPPKKQIFVDETVFEFRLRSGRSILFAVALSHFNWWVTIEVPFRFDWDRTLYHPSHHAFFGNMDLPEQVFRKTKLCRKVDWCRHYKN